MSREDADYTLMMRIHAALDDGNRQAERIANAAERIANAAERIAAALEGILRALQDGVIDVRTEDGRT